MGRLNLYTLLTQVNLVTDKITGKPKGYAFVEFEREKDMKTAYKEGGGTGVEGRRLLVDVERGRTVKGWKPRRLGGGLGEARNGRPPRSRYNDRGPPRRSSFRDGGRDSRDGGRDSGRDSFSRDRLGPPERRDRGSFGDRERGSFGGPSRGSDRGSFGGADRGSDRGGSRGPERGPERGERGPDRGDRGDRGGFGGRERPGLGSDRRRSRSPSRRDR
jgi:U1 small nuclear ribonucleoprotein 70kDa